MPIFDETNFSESKVTWEDLYSLLCRHRWTILLVFVATVLSTYGALQLMTERYESTADLLVKLGRENAEIPSTVLKTGLVTAGVQPEEINSEIQLLTSEPLASAVVDKMGPRAFAFEPPRPTTLLEVVKYNGRRAIRWVKAEYQSMLIALNLRKKLTEREAAIELVHNNTSASPDKSSHVLTLSVQLPNPLLAQQVAQNLLALYLDKRTHLLRDNDERGFFDMQVQQNQQRLKELDAQRDEVRKKWNLSSAEEQRSNLLKQLSGIGEQIDANASDAAMLERQRDVMRSRLAGLSQQVPSSQVQAQNPAIQAIKERLAALEVERAKLASRYLPDAGPLEKTEEEIADLNRMLNSESPTLLGSVVTQANPVRRSFEDSIEEADVKIEGLRAKNTEMRNPEQTIEARLQALNQGEDVLATLDREYKIAEENYLTYARRSEEARINDELDARRVANVVVLSEPTLHREPAYPPKLLITGIALPVGLVLGFALSLLLEYFDDTVHSRRDLIDVEGLNYLGALGARPSSLETQTTVH
jgi:uncharacterized protein involved in exopolysaccharide biosynthesis